MRVDGFRFDLATILGRDAQASIASARCSARCAPIRSSPT
jgi:pullulanase/glycogen debranching enzyme